jgi:hypothetical protein
MNPTFYVVACALTLFSSTAQQALKATQLFSLTLHPLEAPVKAGTEVHLTVTVKNTSDHDLTLGFLPGTPPYEAMTYEIEVRDAEGREAPPTALLRSLREHLGAGFQTNAGYVLAPGKSSDEQLDITRLYVLTTPGKYTIRVARRQNPLRKTDEGIVRSNTITITVIK